MRPLIMALSLTLAPAAASAQPWSRSLALELGFTRDSIAALGDRSPVALVATWWLTGDLDATVRVAWGFAARTEGRAAADSFEAGLGARYGLARWSSLRPQIVVDAAFVQLMGRPAQAPWTCESGVRLGAGAALEAFLARGVSLSIVAQASELLLVPEEAGPGVALALRIGAYF